MEDILGGGDVLRVRIGGEAGACIVGAALRVLLFSRASQAASIDVKFACNQLL